MEWPFLRNFGITLFALLNALGMLPIFIGYTAGERKQVQRLVALFVATTVFLLLVLFMLLGTSLLKFFGVTLHSFRIAGGLLLLGIGIDIVNGKGSGATSGLSLADADSSSILQAKSVYRQIVIPMAMPLLVGPGVIANVILYATEAADRHKDGLRFELILVTAVVCMVVFLVLASGSRLQRLLGDIGLSITQRVMGLFVAAIGMQFIVTGVVDVFATEIVPRLRS